MIMPSKNLTTKDVKEFIKESISELKALLPPQYHSWQNTKVYRNHGDFSYQQSTRPEMPFLLVSSFDKGKLPNVAKFTDLLENDTRFQELRSLFSTPNYFGMLIKPTNRIPLLNILNDYIYLVEDLEFRDDLATLVSNNFISSLETKTFTIIYCSVLSGLDCDFGDNALVGEISVRKLEDDEVAALIDQYMLLIENDHIGYNQWVVEKSITFSFEESASHELTNNTLTQVWEDFEKLLTALRILKEGEIDRYSIFSKRIPGAIVNTQYVSSSFKLKHKKFLYKQYILGEDDRFHLQVIYNFLKDSSFPPKIQLAVDRVNLAAERSNPDDKIIDLMIAAEALFGGSGKTEVTYRLRLRAAKYLGKDLQERKTIVGFLKEAYDRRSSIVHGDRVATNKRPTSEIVIELSQHIRRAIKVMMNELSSHNQLKFDDEYFDDLLLS